MRRAALAARAELREGRKVHRLVESNTLELREMDTRRQRLYNDCVSHVLHKKVDAANVVYGHGVARTNNYGFAEGEQIGQKKTVTERVSALLQLSAGRGKG